MHKICLEHLVTLKSTDDIKGFMSQDKEAILKGCLLVKNRAMCISKRIMMTKD